MSNSARNGKKKIFFLPIMAIFGGCGGTAAATAIFLKVSKNLCQEKTFSFSYLYSENKTKPKNHGLHESCKIPPPSLNKAQGQLFSIHKKIVIKRDILKTSHLL